MTETKERNIYCASTSGGCKGRRTESYQDEEDELAFRLFAGKEDLLSFLDKRLRFGAELGYGNYGNFNAVEVDAIDLTATGRFGIGSGWDIIARVGGAYWDAVGDDVDATGALGVTKTIGDSLRLRLEYLEIHDVEGEDLSAVLLGASHRF